jgi:nitrite reductase (NADH) small subunit
VGNGTVVCPLHEWRFDLETGATLNGECPIAVYPIALDEGGNLSLQLP